MERRIFFSHIHTSIQPSPKTILSELQSHLPFVKTHHQSDHRHFEFYADEDGCNYTLACDALTNIPCGGYALKLGPHDVCHSGLKYRCVNKS